LQATEDNTALLWSLLAKAAEWAMKQRHDAPDSAARIATDAKQHSTPLTDVLAKNLVDALESKDCRGPIGALEDTKHEIKEATPDEAAVRKVLRDMLALIDHGGKDFEGASRVVRHFLTRPFTVLPAEK
jgi:hypothetical protein